MNKKWVENFLNMTIFHKPTIRSHHCPLVIQMSHKDTRGARPFRFKEAWTREPQCKEVISGEWKYGLQAGQAKLHNKLARCKEKLKQWGR